jgi:hypothetical protein
LAVDVPVCAGDGGVELDVLGCVVLLCHAPPVLCDLAAGGVVLGPVGLGGVGGLVDVGGDVALDAGVDVGVPRAALWCLLERICQSEYGFESLQDRCNAPKS